MGAKDLSTLGDSVLSSEEVYRSPDLAERMERFHTETSDDRVAELKDQARRKIALMPFVEDGRLVHVFDGSGKAYPARQVTSS